MTPAAFLASIPVRLTKTERRMLLLEAARRGEFSEPKSLLPDLLRREMSKAERSGSHQCEGGCGRPIARTRDLCLSCAEKAVNELVESLAFPPEDFPPENLARRRQFVCEGLGLELPA
jgi:hypothetical protein